MAGPNREDEQKRSIHDLNNHLAVIKLYVQLGLRSPGLTDDLKEGFEVILGELDKIKKVKDTSNRFRTLLGNLPGMVYRCLNKPGWPMDFVSEGCYPLTGFKPEEIFPGVWNYEDLIHPKDRAMVINKVTQGVESGEPFTLEYRINTKDGKEKWVWERGREMTGPGGKEKWLEGFIMDITERKKAQQALLESEEKYAVAFHSSPYAMIFTRLADGYILDVNHTFEVMSGYPADEVKGNYTLAIDIWANAEDRKEVVEDLSNNVQVRNREYRFRKKDGEIRLGEYSADIISLNNEPFILSSFNDITVHKKIEDEQLRLREQLYQAQKMEVVGRLAGGVAHEFNNTLQIIKTYAELSLMKLEEPGPVNSFLDQIIASTRQSSGIVNQLLAFARKQSVSPEVINLNTLIEGMIMMLEKLTGENVEVTWAPGRDLWKIKMDPSQINQVLMNVILNARDAIHGKGKIIIKTSNKKCKEDCGNHNEENDAGDYVLLKVTDDGEGMDTKTLEQVFEPFFTTKKKFKGTGLGLSTVYGIVKQNGGFIELESSTKKGTTFKIHFPRHEET